MSISLCPLLSHLVGWGAGAGSLFQDSLKHIPVSLDTRLPASYGPGTNYPPRHWIHLHKANSLNQEGLVFQDGTFVAEWVPYLPSGPYETGSFIRVHRDVFTTCAEGRYGTRLAGLLPQHSPPYQICARYSHIISCSMNESHQVKVRYI